MKPLFIPLMKEYFEAFERREKDTEFRVYGPRWNEGTCVIDRPVVLSCGYGKQRRLNGIITSFKHTPFDPSIPEHMLMMHWKGIGNSMAEIGIEIIR
jgi:hypothetical protein